MSMNDRENDFEARYAHDLELRFRVQNRRNRLLGLWAAGKLAKTGAEAEEYAKSLMMSGLSRAGDEDVFGKVHADFAAAGVAQSDHQIRRHMAEFMTEAEKQVAHE